MKIINNTKNPEVKIDKLEIGELFLFNEKLYMKITYDAQYYLAFANSKSYPVSEAIDAIYQSIEEFDDKKDLSSVLSGYAYNVFNLTNNRLEYIEDTTVTLVEGALTIKNA